MTNSEKLNHIGLEVNTLSTLKNILYFVFSGIFTMMIFLYGITSINRDNIYIIEKDLIILQQKVKHGYGYKSKGNDEDPF